MGKSGYIPPTDTFSEDAELTIAGVRIQVFYTGGEAISEFGLYLPDFDMVLIADEFFYALANVHSIRGSKPRLPENYMKALDTVREIKPEWLLGSHIMPIQGREDIQRYVTTSHDAIQYLWDQGIRYINKGYTPAELQQQFRELPPYLDIAPLYPAHVRHALDHRAGAVYWLGKLVRRGRHRPVAHGAGEQGSPLRGADGRA